jgi:hypothetical protein
LSNFWGPAHFINEHLHLAGPPYFAAAFILSYISFYRLTKKAAAGKIKWLIRRPLKTQHSVG